MPAVETTLWWFLHEHRGNPVVSPVLLKHMVDAFVASIGEFVEREAIPVVHFERGQRKEEIARRYLSRFKRSEGVVMIGVAQEMVASFRVYQKGPRRRRRTPRGGRPPCFSFYRGQLDVNQYYFYILDRDFGLCSIKFFLPPMASPPSASLHRRRSSRWNAISALDSANGGEPHPSLRSLLARPGILRGGYPRQPWTWAAQTASSFSSSAGSAGALRVASGPVC
jgi:hypothetical protein